MNSYGINEIRDEQIQNYKTKTIVKRNIVAQLNFSKGIMNNKFHLCNPTEYYSSIEEYIAFVKNDILQLDTDEPKARRIDITKDFKYANNDEVSAVIKMLKCCSLSKHCKWKKINDTNYKTSIYAVNNSYNINFYSKSDERKNKGEFEEAELTNGILRVEFQCKTKKLQSIRNQFHEKNTFLLYCKQPLNVIERCFKINFTTGNWLTLNKAIEKIRGNKTFTAAKSERIINWLKIINTGNLKQRKNTLEKLLNSDNSEIKKSTLTSYIKDLEKMGIAIFSLPDSLSKTIGKDELINPYQKIDKNC